MVQPEDFRLPGGASKKNLLSCSTEVIEAAVSAGKQNQAPNCPLFLPRAKGIFFQFLLLKTDC